jgi:DNA-binding CsgD family transcriptional regulator
MNTSDHHLPGCSLFPSEVWAHLCRVLQLSPREIQIVQGVFDDHKEETIACNLGISPHTVNTYFQRLYAKLHVSSRPQLILRILAEYLKPAGRVGPMSRVHTTGEYLT